ncbi:MAG TPA: hypothetical protein PK176_05325 [Acidobacteriota bacterium]|nr:hypothetical protein [Acidobacteriota bacterium]HQM62712.1 hypothetical protein [Acidobacteriota bacterium]
MTNTTRLVLFWTPRVLGILFATFISLFALDVFEGGFRFPDTLIALFMHLIPTFLLVITLLVAWRWEWVGTVVFIGLAVYYVVWAWGRFPWVTYAAISGPLAVMGGLFLLNWVWRAKMKG